MCADGRIAVQSFETVLHDIARETARVRNVPLSVFGSATKPIRVVIQADAARIRTRQFVACVAKKPQLDSQSCFSLRPLALG
eukprot:3953507-Pleurochrysis_carterae.AAC.1